MSGFELNNLQSSFLGFCFFAVGLCSSIAGMVFCELVLWPRFDRLRK